MQTPMVCVRVVKKLGGLSKSIVDENAGQGGEAAARNQKPQSWGTNPAHPVCTITSTRAPRKDYGIS